MIYFESVVDLGFQFIKLWPSKKKIIKLWTGHVEKKKSKTSLCAFIVCEKLNTITIFYVFPNK